MNSRRSRMAQYHFTLGPVGGNTMYSVAVNDSITMARTGSTANVQASTQ